MVRQMAMWHLFAKRIYALTLFGKLEITNTQSTSTCEHYKNVNRDILLKNVVMTFEIFWDFCFRR